VKFRSYYIAGLIYVVSMLLILYIFVTGRILNLTNIYLPYFSKNEYFNNFFDIWKIADNGSVSNAPLSDLISGFFSLIGLSPSEIQYVVFSLLVLVSYSSLFLLFSYIGKNKYLISLILSIAFLYFEFGWAGLIYATGLNYFLAASPMVIYLSIRINRGDIKKSRGIVYIAIFIAVASFGITEALPYIAFIYIPVFIMSLIDNVIFKHTFKTIKNFIERQLEFLAGVFFAIIILIYIYYEWITAAFGIGHNSSLLALSSLYKTVNFFKANAFSSLGNGFSLIGNAFLLKGGYAYVSGIIFIAIGIFYLFLKRKDSLAISSMVSIIFIAAYVQVAISFPSQLFFILSKIPVVSSFVEVVNEPAQIFYLLFIWEYILASIIIFETYKWALSKNFLERSKSGRALKIFFRRNIKYSKIIASILIVLIIIMMGFSEINSSRSIAESNASYTPYGHYNIPNDVPSYIHNIYDKIYGNSSNNGIQYTLFLPDVSQVEQYNCLSPLFYSFPPSNSYQMSDFISFINNINSGNENGTGILLAQMDIGYIVVLNDLKQNETGPTIGYDNFLQPYAIFGNPIAFYNYFAKSPDYSLIVKTDNYSIFKNLENQGMFDIYQGSYYESTRLISFNSTRDLMVNPNITYNPESENLLAGSIAKSKWSSFGNNISTLFEDNAMHVKFPYHIKGYFASYSNGFAVTQGDKFSISSNVTAMNSSSGIYYMGFDCGYANETIVPGKYWQNGIYSIEANSTTHSFGEFTVPANVTYIEPYIAFHNPSGEFEISNISIRLIELSENYSHTYQCEEQAKNLKLSASMVSSPISKTFPNTELAALKINEEKTINYSLYNGRITGQGIYVIMPEYQFTKYGFIGGNANFTTLNPNTYEYGNINAANGSYMLSLDISGYGYGNIYINNIAYPYDTLLNGSYLKIANVKVSGNTSIAIYNAVGYINLIDPLLIGPNMPKSTEMEISGSVQPVNYKSFSNDYSRKISIDINSTKPVILDFKMNYYSG
jgi:hypothetical protein